jgi:hypothetical protein
VKHGVHEGKSNQNKYMVMNGVKTVMIMKIDNTIACTLFLAIQCMPSSSGSNLTTLQFYS